jgi:hypothetical protein
MYILFQGIHFEFLRSALFFWGGGRRGQEEYPAVCHTNLISESCSVILTSDEAQWPSAVEVIQFSGCQNLVYRHLVGFFGEGISQL